MSLPPPPPSGVQLQAVLPDGSPCLLDEYISVLVADCHTIVREGLKALVNAQPDMRVIGEAGDGSTALALAAELDPDVVIVEVFLPGLDGAETTTRLLQTRPDRKVIILTAREERVSLRRLLEVGAAGYVLKRASAKQLAQAIRTVSVGGTYIDSEMTVEQVGGSSADEELSEREIQVLRLLTLGYSNKQVAAQLNLSVKTIETYKARAMKKLNIRTRVELVRYAIGRGWMGAT